MYPLAEHLAEHSPVMGTGASQTGFHQPVSTVGCCSSTVSFDKYKVFVSNSVFNPQLCISLHFVCHCSFYHWCVYALFKRAQFLFKALLWQMRKTTCIRNVLNNFKMRKQKWFLFFFKSNNALIPSSEFKWGAEGCHHMRGRVGQNPH